jgi:hypothetical protein
VELRKHNEALLIVLADKRSENVQLQQQLAEIEDLKKVRDELVVELERHKKAAEEIEATASVPQQRPPSQPASPTVAAGAGGGLKPMESAAIGGVNREAVPTAATSSSSTADPAVTSANTRATTAAPRTAGGYPVFGSAAQDRLNKVSRLLDELQSTK